MAFKKSASVESLRVDIVGNGVHGFPNTPTEQFWNGSVVVRRLVTVDNGNWAENKWEIVKNLNQPFFI